MRNVSIRAIILSGLFALGTANTSLSVAHAFGCQADCKDGGTGQCAKKCKG